MSIDAPPVLDERDQTLINRRMETLDRIPGPRVGDFVAFADGVLRRISHDWGDAVQTSAGGDWYLGDGYVSFSGGLFSSVPKSTLRLKDDRLRNGKAWLFHHDMWRAHNGVHFEVPWRVYECSLPAPR